MTHIQDFEFNEELIRSKIEREHNRREILAKWCKQTQAKLASWVNSGEQWTMLYMPTIFDYKGTDLALWHKEIIQWCRTHALKCRVEVHDMAVYLVIHKA